MKNLLYIASLLLLVFTACDPMEDTYKELDEANAQKVADEKYFAARTVLDENYTLVDADYALSTNKDLKKYKSFSSKVEAKNHMAQILDAKMVYGKSAVDYKVTYKYYRGGLRYVKDYIKFLDAVASLKSYTLTKADYDSMGTEKGQPGKYDNFSKDVPAADYLPDFLKNKFPDAKKDDVIVVTYRFYKGGGVTVDISENWEYDGNIWKENKNAGPKSPELPEGVKVYQLVKADYKSMGFKYPNFSGSSKPQDYLPTFLGIKFPYAKEGDKLLVVYDFYGKKNKDDEKNTSFKQALEYTLTNGVWTVYSSIIMQTATMSYKVSDKAWLYVFPVKFEYTTEEPTREEIILKNEDYALTGDGKYKNFDIRDKSEEEQKAMFMAKLSVILKANYGPVKAGEVFKVTFKVYTGKKEERTVLLKAVLDA